MNRNEELLLKLSLQISAHKEATGHPPDRLELTHDEIDAWRSQFEEVIPVSLLAYQGIPIVCIECERERWTLRHPPDTVTPPRGFFLDQDNDGHWFVVPTHLRATWDAWLDLPRDHEAAWDPPAGCTQLDGGPSWVEFPSFTLRRDRRES